RPSQGRARARLHPRHHARQPARRARVRPALRAPHVRLPRLALRDARRRPVEGRRGASAARRERPPTRRRGRNRRRLRRLARLRVGFERPHGRRGGVERRHGVPASQSRNAARTLLIMAAAAISLFLGVSYLAVRMHARPSSTDSVLSEIARGVFGAGSSASAAYYVVQATTLAILIFAANTSFQGFPRLAALLARDRFF